MSLKAELKQAIYDLPLAHKPGRDEIAHFCEHNGISRTFTRARTTWQALAPSAIKPWWVILEPLKNKSQKTGDLKQNENCGSDTSNHSNNKNIDTEVLDNA